MGIERDAYENAKEAAKIAATRLNTEPTRRHVLKGLAATLFLGDAGKILSSLGDTQPKRVHQIFASTSQPIDRQTVRVQEVQLIADPTQSPLGPIQVEKPNPPLSLIDQLKLQRPPDGKRNDELETRIALEVLKEVNLTKEGYEKFKASIHRDNIGVFENAGVILKSKGRFIKTRPKYFIFHHTGHVYEDSTNTLIDGLLREKLSVQWEIDRNATCNQFVSDPEILGYQHAKDFNLEAVGVEMETWPGKKEADIETAKFGITRRPGFQGDLTATQYEAAAYLGIYNVHELWGVALSDVTSYLVGHREINDRTGKGTPGKPDFYQAVMDPFRAIIGAFLPQVAS